MFKQNFKTEAEEKKKKVSFERQSVRAFSINTTNTATRQRQQTWLEPKYSLSIEIFECIMKFLEPRDAVKLLFLCQVWSGPACEAFYQSPPINTAASFPKLTALMLNPKTTHPYALLVREFIFAGPAADDLMMGDLKDCLKVCTNLASLRLEGCNHLSSLLAQFLQEHAPFLSRIELPFCSISDSFLIKLIRGVRTLRHIDVSGTNVSLASLPLIVRECEFVETLDMTGCLPTQDSMVIDYETSEYYLVGDTLKQYRNLSLIQLSLSHTEVTDSMIGYICRHCDNLSILLLEGCICISDAAINSIAMHCRSLKELDVGFCSSITDVGIQQLAVHLSVQPIQQDSNSYTAFQEYRPNKTIHSTSQLRRINLSRCIHITPTSVLLLAKNCPLLDTIQLDGCTKIINWYCQGSYVIPELMNESSFSGYSIDSDNESFVSAKSFPSAEEFVMDWNEIKKLTLSRQNILWKHNLQ